MTRAVTIKRPDVVAMIEAMAERHTGRSKTEAVALALRRLQDGGVRSGSLFGARRGSVTVRDGVDLTAPVLGDPRDAETGYGLWGRAGPDEILLDPRIPMQAGLV